MTEQISPPPAAAPAPTSDKKKARRIETMGMIAFICFGIVGAVLAAILLLPRLRIIWSLPAVTRTLTLIALIGLIAHAVLAFGRIGKPSHAAREILDPQGYARLAPQGSQEWTIGPTTYHIASTCYFKGPEGVQYNIYVEHRLPPGDPPALEDALAIARPFIMYAYKHGYHLRASAQPRGEALVPGSIVVSLFERRGRETRICRSGMSMDQIRWRAAAENGPSSETAPASQL